VTAESIPAAQSLRCQNGPAGADETAQSVTGDVSLRSRTLAQGEGVGGGADLPTGGFGVDLGGAQRGVPEEVLHDGGGFAQADELHGDGVPEGVRRGPGGRGTPARANQRRTEWSSAAVLNRASRVLRNTGSFLRAGVPVRA